MKATTLGGGISARTLEYYRDLILVLLAKEFKVRYKSTFMGYAWSLLHPLALALIFYGFFRAVLRVDLPAYALYLIAGLFPWQWVANTTGGANGYFLGNSSLIKKVRFHRATLALSSVLNDSVHFLCSVPVILGFMLFFGHAPGWIWLWGLPLLWLMQVAMMFGLGLAIATSNLFFRDLERLASLVTQMLFYLTPIVYPPETVPANYQWVFYANPFASLIISWQGLFYHGAIDPLHLACAAAWTAVWLVAGVWTYQRNVWRFAEIV